MNALSHVSLTVAGGVSKNHPSVSPDVILGVRATNNEQVCVQSYRLGERERK